jgi:hypothetical protein
VSEFKVGDKVWVLCEVINRSESSTWVEVGSRQGRVWINASDCRPVEPPVIKESLTTESNCPEIPDGSFDLVKVGDAVRFVSPGHKRHGTEGILKSIHHGPKNAYFFISNCGQFHRYCTASELERTTKRYREPTLADLANGPIACEYRDCDDEQWRSGFLVHILNGAIPFLCVNEEQELFGQWDQCRIEVTE